MEVSIAIVRMLSPRAMHPDLFTELLTELRVTLPMSASADFVTCHAPETDKEPIEVEKWKYDLIRHAILANVPNDDVGIMLKQLRPLVRNFLTRQQRDQVGRVAWHTMTVKLDLESRGEIMRIEGMRPQYLRRTVPT